MLLGQHPPTDIQTAEKMSIGKKGDVGALISEGKGEGQRYVVKGIGRGPRYGTRHVGNAVVDDVVQHVGRRGVRGRSTGLEAPALIARHIDKHGSRLHSRYEFLGHALWCRGALHQDGTDDEVSSKDLSLERVIGRVDRLEFSPETTGKPVEHVEIAVENGDL